MNNRPSKSGSFISSLTSFIDNNKQEIKSTLILSSIMTACIIAMVTFNQELSTTLSHITHVISTLASEAVAIVYAFILSVFNTIAFIAQQCWYSFMRVFGKIVAFVSAISIQTQLLVHYVGEFKSATSYLFSLPITEMANISIKTIGYSGTVIYIFTTTSYLTYKIRRALIDTVSFYSGKGCDFNEMSMLSRILIVQAAMLWTAKELIKYIWAYIFNKDVKVVTDLMTQGVEEAKKIIFQYKGKLNTDKTSE